jgi:hypothetical protein
VTSNRDYTEPRTQEVWGCNLPHRKEADLPFSIRLLYVSSLNAEARGDGGYNVVPDELLYYFVRTAKHPNVAPPDLCPNLLHGYSAEI